MSGNNRDIPSGTVQQRSSPRGLFTPELRDLILPPLKIGTWTGTCGVLTGVGVSIFRETNPFIWGTVTGLHWFTLGSSFWFTRSMTIRAWGGEEQVTLSDKTKASAMAGTVAGAMGGLIRGPRNILSAMAYWTVFGACGQLVANHWATREVKDKGENDSWLRSKWSPLKKLTDDEYLDMMSEKMLRVEADIALIDDRIAELRDAEEKAKEAVSESGSPFQ